MFGRFGPRTAGVAGLLSAVMFHLWDNEAIASVQRGEYAASGAFAVFAAGFLILAIVSMMLAIYMLWAGQNKT